MSLLAIISVVAGIRASAAESIRSPLSRPACPCEFALHGGRRDRRHGRAGCGPFLGHYARRSVPCALHPFAKRWGGLSSIGRTGSAVSQSFPQPRHGMVEIHVIDGAWTWLRTVSPRGRAARLAGAGEGPALLVAFAGVVALGAGHRARRWRPDDAPPGNPDDDRHARALTTCPQRHRLVPAARRVALLFSRPHRAAPPADPMFAIGATALELAFAVFMWYGFATEGT